MNAVHTVVRRTSPALIALVFWLALVAGCSSPQASRQAESPAVRSNTILLTPEQVAARSRQASAATPLGLSTDDVLAGPEVKAYSMGRYVDAGDPTILHEAHVVYRRESGPQWRLDPAGSRPIAIGPAVSGRVPGDLHRAQEWEAALADLRKAQRRNEQALEGLTRAMEALARNQEATVTRLSTDADHTATTKRSTVKRSRVDEAPRKSSRPLATGSVAVRDEPLDLSGNDGR